MALLTQQWSPTTIEEVNNEDIDRIFEAFSSEYELQVPSDDSNRCWVQIFLTVRISDIYPR